MMRTNAANNKRTEMANSHAVELLDMLIFNSDFWRYIDGLELGNILDGNGKVRATAIVRFLDEIDVKTIRGKSYSASTLIRVRDRILEQLGIDLFYPPDLRDYLEQRKVKGEK